MREIMDVRPSHPVIEVLAEAVLRTRMAVNNHLPKSGVKMYDSKMLQQRKGEQPNIGGLQVVIDSQLQTDMRV